MLDDIFAPWTNEFTISVVNAETTLTVDSFVSLALNGNLSRCAMISFDGGETVKMQIRPSFAMITVGTPTREQFCDFFQPSGDTILEVPLGWRMPQIMKLIGAFPSASQAAKNGWNKDIPAGFSEHVVKVGKAKGVIHILNLNTVKV